MSTPVFADPFATQQQVADAIAKLDEALDAARRVRVELERGKGDLDALASLLDAGLLVVKNMEVSP